MSGTPIQAGDAGEDLTRRLLDQCDVSWFFVEQDRATKSTRLRALGAKRVDLVVAFQGTSLLLDSKCQHPSKRAPDGSLTFGLERTEIARLEATAKEFGLPLAVIFWDRGVQSATYVIEYLDRLDREVEIAGKPGLAACFERHETCDVMLFD
ncbi:hypothetical protein FSB78_10535 [Sphingomonas ginsenosidivorax]|uniref:Holliday junction resolvase n=2 Tax=Sphingomonas ginsenosidivorax TaxID=862135 RepID=A0A5C6UFW6_9SPHN|nr:hypothetical protein FSB78_10535 [Sphingomonas ginsenosidivorax]